MRIVEQLDQARARLNVLQHPFYERWTRGELSRDELRGYAAQYRHLVVALAEVSRQAAESAPGDETSTLNVHAREEAEHVAIWDRFAEALGSDPEEPLAATRECAESWTAGATSGEHLAVMYVIEASQPAISTTKLAGLAEHYELAEGNPACDYFREHAVRDIAHSNQARAMIERHLAQGDEADGESMVTAATAALEGNWAMLSAVEEERTAAAV